jgi:gluconate 2-dehydrogenase gamma chain
MSEDRIPRRSFLKGAGVAGTAVAGALAGTLTNPAEAQAQANAAPLPPAREPLLTLTATEAAFLSAAYDTLIPDDRLSPSGTDCGLVTYIDRQLAGAWGGGARLYLKSPGPLVKA